MKQLQILFVSLCLIISSLVLGNPPLPNSNLEDVVFKLHQKQMAQEQEKLQQALTLKLAEEQAAKRLGEQQENIAEKLGKINAGMEAVLEKLEKKQQMQQDENLKEIIRALGQPRVTPILEAPITQRLPPMPAYVKTPRSSLKCSLNKEELDFFASPDGFGPLIKQLDSDIYDERQKAMYELLKRLSAMANADFRSEDQKSCISALLILPKLDLLIRSKTDAEVLSRLKYIREQIVRTAPPECIPIPRPHSKYCACIIECNFEPPQYAYSNVRKTADGDSRAINTEEDCRELPTTIKGEYCISKVLYTR